MAEDENTAGAAEGGGGSASVDDEGNCPPCRCEECIPGLPGWMSTFSDMVTLLLTFFVLLLSFAKTETAKYESALGSIRQAMGGNVLKYGEVIERGKSADNQPTMMESAEIIKPFPIEFLTTEGFLDKREINRSSEEELSFMRSDLNTFNLSESVDIYEEAEGIKVRVKEAIFFDKGSDVISKGKVSVEVFERMVNLLTGREWVIFVEGHANRGERSADGSLDALMLSAQRATSVTRVLIKMGVSPEQITTLFYGDTRPQKLTGEGNFDRAQMNRRVEFMIRKRDLQNEGHKVSPQ